MFFRPSLLALYILLILCSVFGIYRLHAQIQERPHPPAMSPQEHVNDDVVNPESDFYQTIIKNNLFAPLGTVLTVKPRPGSNLTLIATLITSDPLSSQAVIKNASTGRQETYAIGETISDFIVIVITPKEVILQRDGEPLRLRLATEMLLN